MFCVSVYSWKPASLVPICTAPSGGEWVTHLDAGGCFKRCLLMRRDEVKPDCHLVRVIRACTLKRTIMVDSIGCFFSGIKRV